MLRVCDPDWEDPLDAAFSLRRGGRWNAPDSFTVLYLNADERTARANVVRRFRGLPYGPEDLADDGAPQLVAVDLVEAEYADCESARGLVAWGLPATYPLDAGRDEVTWDRCQPIGRRAHDARLAGIACRSATAGAEAGLRDIAHIPRATDVPLAMRLRTPFSDWFWTEPEP